MFRKVTVILTAIVSMMAIYVTPSAAVPVFTDDFTSGNLNNWTIGGRQAAGSINVANVVTTSNGTLGGHIYHRSFTEIAMYRDFGYNSNFTFSFDMEVDTLPNAGGPSNYYGMGGAYFDFLNSTGDILGGVRYMAASNDWIFTASPYQIASPYNTMYHFNSISENIMGHYNLSVADLLSQISIDMGQVTTLRMGVVAYSSYGGNEGASVWLDNVLVDDGVSSNSQPVPEPSTLLLLGSGVAGLGFVRRKLGRSRKGHKS